MASNMPGTLASLSINTDLCEINIPLLSAINALLLVVLIPLLDLLIVPLLRHILMNPSIMCRLGLGSFLAFVTNVIILVIHLVGDVNARVCIFHTIVSTLKMDINVYWILMPVILLTIAELFIYIPGKHHSYYFYLDNTVCQ